MVETRRILGFAALGASVALAGGAVAPLPATVRPAPALAITVPTTPTVTVAVPPLPVKPPVPVKAPPVKVPPVSLPTPPKLPPVPPVPLKKPSLPVKAPGLPVHAPKPGLPGRPALPGLPGAPHSTPGLPVSPGGLPGHLGSGGGRGGSRSSAAPGGRAAGSGGGGPAPLSPYGSAGSGAGEALRPAAVAAPGAGYAPSAIREIGRATGRHHGKLGAARLRQIVEALRGCLPGLGGRLQEVLRLETGIGGGRPLGVRGVARHLHVSTAQAGGLEVLALRRLRAEAQTTSCARASVSSYASRPPIGLTGGVIDLAAPFASPRGGVAGAFYLKAATAPPATPEGPRASQHPNGASVVALGRNHGHAGSPLLVLALLALGGIVLTGVLFSESLGAVTLTRLRRTKAKRP